MLVAATGTLEAPGTPQRRVNRPWSSLRLDTWVVTTTRMHSQGRAKVHAWKMPESRVWVCTETSHQAPRLRAQPVGCPRGMPGAQGLMHPNRGQPAWSKHSGFFGHDVSNRASSVVGGKEKRKGLV